MNKGLQTIRLWNPLFPQIYKRDGNGKIAAEPIESSSSEMDEDLSEKVYRITPSVEACAGQLWGVTEVQLYQIWRSWQKSCQNSFMMAGAVFLSSIQS